MVKVKSLKIFKIFFSFKSFNSMCCIVENTMVDMGFLVDLEEKLKKEEKNNLLS